MEGEQKCRASMYKYLSCCQLLSYTSIMELFTGYQLEWSLRRMMGSAKPENPFSSTYNNTLLIF